MFVIFPADEVVYLSYGRLIVVPANSNLVNSNSPIRTNSLPPENLNLTSFPSEKIPNCERITYSEPTLAKIESHSSKNEPSSSRSLHQNVPDSKNVANDSRSKRKSLKLNFGLLRRFNSKDKGEPHSSRVRCSIGHRDQSGLTTNPSETFRTFCEISPSPSNKSNVKDEDGIADYDREGSSLARHTDSQRKYSPSKRSSSSSKSSKQQITESDQQKPPKKASQTSKQAKRDNNNTSPSLNCSTGLSKSRDFAQREDSNRKISSSSHLEVNFYPLSTSREKNLEEPSSEPKIKSRSNSISLNFRRSKTPDISSPLPGRAKTKKDKKVPSQKSLETSFARKLSFSDYFAVGREKLRDDSKPAQSGTSSQTTRDKSGLFSIFRKASSPKNLGRDRTPNHNSNLDTNQFVSLGDSMSRDKGQSHSTVSDFTQQLGQLHGKQAEELQMLVSSFKKKNIELRKERPTHPSSLFNIWEGFLQEVDLDAKSLEELSSIIGSQISRNIMERTYHRKIQSRKVFAHRENYETIIAKTEEKLAKTRLEYKAAYMSYLSNSSIETSSSYISAHNAYVQQLHATNGMIEEFGEDTLPSLLQELDEIHSDLCSAMSDSIKQGAELISARGLEQSKRYDNLVEECKSVSGTKDLINFTKSLPSVQNEGFNMKRPFLPFKPDTECNEVTNNQMSNESVLPLFKDELVINQNSAIQIKPSHDALQKEFEDLQGQIKQFQESLDSLLRIQQKSMEASLFNKANDLQEDISRKRFDLHVAQIHLSAINAQKELFAQKLDGDTITSRDRRMSTSSSASMKTKWMKAFKSLKPPPPEEIKKNGSAVAKELLKGDPDAHNFQENTYKKITPCDVCSQILRGHTRQGLKCRICKINVHFHCQKEVHKCTTKAKLLRRQKSTSEIETGPSNMNIEDERTQATEVDQIYQVLKQATEISNSKPRVEAPGIIVEKGSLISSPSGSGQSISKIIRSGLKQPTRMDGSNLVVCSTPCSTVSAPHSPRRQKLNLRMKSLSLDSPESNEQAQRRQRHGTTSDPHSTHSSSSKIQSPSSPVHSKRLLSAKNVRMASMELPDEIEKSPSSASVSPCPSPVGKKSQRLITTYLYVVLYNFNARHQDELDLKAGYKVTVIDTSDNDWWKGKCFGKVGYFPSKYVSKLSPGEKPLQVTHNLQVSDGDGGLMLLRDQIVIQIGEEIEGMVMIRSGDKRQGVCPMKFLQEV